MKNSFEISLKITLYNIHLKVENVIKTTKIRILVRMIYRTTRNVAFSSKIKFCSNPFYLPWNLILFQIVFEDLNYVNCWVQWFNFYFIYSRVDIYPKQKHSRLTFDSTGLQSFIMKTENLPKLKVFHRGAKT